MWDLFQTLCLVQLKKQKMKILKQRKYINHPANQNLENRSMMKSNKKKRKSNLKKAFQINLKRTKIK